MRPSTAKRLRADAWRFAALAAGYAYDRGWISLGLYVAIMGRACVAIVDSREVDA